MDNQAFTCAVDGVTYYGLVAVDGWPTGPCPSPEKARERLDAYEAGDDVSEAAPQQLSRAQLSAVLRLQHGLAPSIRTRLQELAAEAQLAGLHSEAWIRASAAAVNMWGILPYLAGGARIRRAAGEVSLTRSAQDEEPAGPAGPRWR